MRAWPIHPNDPNYSTHPEHYFQAGESAVRFIRLAKEAAEVKRPLRRILDLPCGYGRVMGALRDAFPEAELTACDIEAEGVDFCARTFGAGPAYATEDPADLDLQGGYDLIWCGSLLTHLGPERWEDFLDLFEANLAGRGLLVFTTCGQHVASKLRHHDPLGLTPDLVDGLLADYRRGGFAYRDYPTAMLDELDWSSGHYGLSLATPAWVCGRLSRRPGLRLVSYLEMGFNHNQDAVAVLNVGS